MSYGEKVNCTCGEPHISDRIVHRQNGLPCYVKEQEKRCPYSDCFRVHYKECSVHGEGTHDHIFSSPCLFVPVQKEKSPECELILDHSVSWCGDGYLCVKCMLRFVPEPEVQKSLQEERQALRKKIGEYLSHDGECILSNLEAGEPTEDGGYRQKFLGQWYQVRPVDERPKCTCGLDKVLSILS